MRAGSNLSNSRKKSSPLILRSNHLAVLNSKFVITRRALADLAQSRAELRELASHVIKGTSGIGIAGLLFEVR